MSLDEQNPAGGISEWHETSCRIFYDEGAACSCARLHQVPMTPPSQPTPGPWKAVRLSPSVIRIVTDDATIIATVDGDMPTAELVAAAWAMRVLLQKIEVAEDTSNSPYDLVDAMIPL